MLKCGGDVRVCTYYNGRHEFVPEIDENKRMICSGDVWDITKYESLP